jgi:hypothetical protein
MKLSTAGNYLVMPLSQSTNSKIKIVNGINKDGN